MHKKTTLSWIRQTLVGIIFVLAAHSVSAQYTNQGYQLQSPTAPTPGIGVTQLATSPVLSAYPVGGPVVVSDSYAFTQTNGTRYRPYEVVYANQNTYASMAPMSFNANPAHAVTQQLILDGAGIQYDLTSEYSTQYDSDGVPYLALIGHYLHAGAQVLSLANAPLRLTLDGTGCSEKVFVLESDANNHAYVEGFRLTFPANTPPNCGPWLPFGAISLPSETPVDIAVIPSGNLFVLGNRTISCVVSGSLYSGAAGVIYVVPQTLGSSTADFMSCRSDGNFVALKGFATGSTGAMGVDASSRFYVYGDILATSGLGHLAYYYGKHSATGSSSIADGGVYPAPVGPPLPPPTELAGRHVLPRLSPQPSIGLSTGAVLADSLGTVYITGSAAPSGSAAAIRTAKFLPGASSASTVVTHANPASIGIAQDALGYVYVATTGYSSASAAYVMAFESYDANGFVGSGQWTTTNLMTGTTLLLRRYTNHKADVFLAGSINYPDSQHMYTGIVTQLSTP